MLRFSPLILPILALLAPFGFAVSASAQSVQDFTLPPPRPAEEPEAEGPADDSGVVPVGPRIIPSAGPSQPDASEPAEAEEPAADGGPILSGGEARVADSQPEPTAAASPVAIRPQPSAVIEQPTDPVTANPRTVASPETATAPDDIYFPPSVPTQNIPIEGTVETEGFPQWLWFVIGGLLILLAAFAGLFRWRRSKAQYVPEIERPIVAGEGDRPRSIAGDIRIDLDVEGVNLSRSLMNLMLNCRISISNRSAHAVRDLGIWADLTSAHSGLPVDQQLIMPETILPEHAKITRIGPHQSRSEQLSLQIPVAELNGFRQGEAALCVPLLRLRMTGPAMEAQTRTFAIGLANGGVTARLQPVPLHVPPGSYSGARARALD